MEIFMSFSPSHRLNVLYHLFSGFAYIYNSPQIAPHAYIHVGHTNGLRTSGDCNEKKDMWNIWNFWCFSKYTKRSVYCIEKNSKQINKSTIETETVKRNQKKCGFCNRYIHQWHSFRLIWIHWNSVTHFRPNDGICIHWFERKEFV